jgi:hypothetical protein
MVTVAGTAMVVGAMVAAAMVAVAMVGGMGVVMAAGRF